MYINLISREKKRNGKKNIYVEYYMLINWICSIYHNPQYSNFLNNYRINLEDKNLVRCGVFHCWYSCGKGCITISELCLNKVIHQERADREPLDIWMMSASCWLLPSSLFLRMLFYFGFSPCPVCLTSICEGANSIKLITLCLELTVFR